MALLGLLVYSLAQETLPLRIHLWTLRYPLSLRTLAARVCWGRLGILRPLALRPIPLRRPIPLHRLALLLLSLLSLLLLRQPRARWTLPPGQ